MCIFLFVQTSMGVGLCRVVSMGTRRGLSVETHGVLSVGVEFPMCDKGLGRELLRSSVVCVYMGVLWV